MTDECLDNLRREAKHNLRDHMGERVRVIWNPEANRWHVFNDCHHPIFTIERLELHTAGCYSELKPNFAPNGSPSFIGTIASEFVLDTKTATRVKSHPYALSKIYFVLGPDDFEDFTSCRRLLLDGPKMYADRRVKQN